MIRTSRIILSAVVWLLSPVSMADTVELEIQYLLEAIGQSECTFIRNDETHNATEAESHLRMKYRNGRRWVDTAEEFIERIATKSAWSGEPYLIDCPGADLERSSEWLTARLAVLRDLD